MRDSSGTFHGAFRSEIVPLGAGGFIAAGIAIADNDDKSCGGDQIGTWFRAAGDTEWTPFIDTTVLPSTMYGAGRLHGAEDGRMGSYAQDICRADSSRVWSVINGYLLKFTRTAGAWSGEIAGGPWMSCKAQDTNQMVPQRMRCDPDNKDAVLFGTRENKIVACVNGTITEIAYASGSVPILVEVDRTSSVVGGVHQRWFAAAASSGVLMSTTGPAGPFTAMTGAPSNPSSLYVDAIGRVWVTQGGANGNIYYWTATSGTWTNVTTLPSEEVRLITVDPNDTNSIFVKTSAGNGYRRSLNGGATWTYYWNAAANVGHILEEATDILWHGTFPAGGTKAGAALVGNNGSAIKAAQFDSSGNLWWAGGIGVYEIPAPLPTSADGAATPANTLKSYERSVGLEMLLTNDILYPDGGDPIYGVWDRLAIKIKDHKRYTNLPNGYRYGEIDGAGNPIYTSLNYCESLSSVPGHPEIVLANMAYNDQVHCASYDYGETWTKLLTHPDGCRWGRFLARNENEALWIVGVNGRQCYTTNLSDPVPTWTVLKTGAGTPFVAKAANLLGSANGQLLYRSKADYAPTIVGSSNVSSQFITITISAASGTGSITEDAAARTCTVVPPSGTTTATALAAYINANSTLITATPTGTGASAFSTGTTTLAYDTGYGYSIFEGGNCKGCVDQNGNIFIYNYGPSKEYTTYRGLWMLPAGADFETGWVRKGGTIASTDSSGIWMACVDNGATATEFFIKPYATSFPLYRSTDGGETFSAIPLTAASCLAIGPVPPGKTRPCIAYAGSYNGNPGVWLWEGTTPGTDAPVLMDDYPLHNPDSVHALAFNPKAYDPAAEDKALLYGGFEGSGGFRIIPTDAKTIN